MKLHENKNEARCTERGAWRDFAKGFIITLAVLLPVYLCVMVWAAGKNTETQQEDAQAAANLQQNAALPPKAYNLHLILQDESGALLGSMLVRFDTPQQTAQLTLLPAETVLLYAKRTVSAAELYTQLGALALQQAVEETLGTAVSGWCCVEASALTGFAQRCGELSLALPQGRLSLTAEQLNTQLDTVQTPAARAQLLQSAAAASAKEQLSAILRQYEIESAKITVYTNIGTDNCIELTKAVVAVEKSNIDKASRAAKAAESVMGITVEIEELT